MLDKLLRAGMYCLVYLIIGNLVWLLVLGLFVFGWFAYVLQFDVVCWFMVMVVFVRLASLTCLSCLV